MCLTLRAVPLPKNTKQLAAVVEIVVEEDAGVKYSTVQNWFPGDEDGNGGIYNFVTRELLPGR